MLQNNLKYYWGLPDTSVSFCEKKYDNIYWIAEYNNTISAIPYVLVGIIFLFTKIKKIGFCMILLGFSTMLMHGTLRNYAQLLDESTLLIISFETLKLLDKRFKYIFLAPAIAIYIMLNENFFIFLSTFIGMQITIVYKVYYKEKSFPQRILSSLYVFFFILAAIFWYIDQTFCKYIGNKPFHALWHINTCIAMFYGYANLIID